MSTGSSPSTRGTCTIAAGAVQLAPSFLYSRDYYSHLKPKWCNKKLENSCITSPTQRFGILSDSTQQSINKPKLKMGDVNIAIIGGGICGVSAAHAIQTRLKTISSDRKVRIVIFEADSNSHQEGTESCYTSKSQPKWKAATNRNANSLGKFRWIEIYIDELKFNFELMKYGSFNSMKSLGLLCI